MIARVIIWTLLAFSLTLILLGIVRANGLERMYSRLLFLFPLLFPVVDSLSWKYPEHGRIALYVYFSIWSLLTIFILLELLKKRNEENKEKEEMQNG